MEEEREFEEEEGVWVVNGEVDEGEVDCEVESDHTEMSDGVEVVDGDDDEEDGGDDEDESEELHNSGRPPVQLVDDDGEGEGDDDSEGHDEEEDDEGDDVDVEMADVALIEQADSGSGKKAAQRKTLLVANLFFRAREADLWAFFKEYAGSIVKIILGYQNGIFQRLAFVEFTTVEVAKKALELNGEESQKRPLTLEFVEEGRSYNEFFSNEENSYQEGGEAQGNTIYVEGFDTSGGERQIRDSLEKHFVHCGKVLEVSIPEDYDGGVGWIASIEFKNIKGFNRARKLNGSKLGGCTLKVEAGKPKREANAEANAANAEANAANAEANAEGGASTSGGGGGATKKFWTTGTGKHTVFPDLD
ncbi:nucleolin 2-like [Cornus florida]|uniref:nucleolin 2-like n=1 Tax=Cornus florida TaxID=4283 RepID=UPI0028973C7E|nr:nucleolin 2-like [Cornus florida]